MNNEGCPGCLNEHFARLEEERKAHVLAQNMAQEHKAAYCIDHDNVVRPYTGQFSVKEIILPKK